MALVKVSSIFLVYLFGFYSQTAAQSPQILYCGCSPILCCSQLGYCGITDNYCGSGCRSGPCRRSRDPVDKIVTQQFFDNIISKASNGCDGKRFYTRESFLEAANATFDFTSSVTSLEIAAMFAHFTYVTEHFCHIEAVNGTSGDSCDDNNKQYPCAPGKSYHGRGPIQLSWNYNYGPCGQGLGLDLLRQPELVGSNATVAFKTGLWFWMNHARPVLS
ncbi:PREDICTED: endochitinase At2g43590-like [Camelina sativa]|uniref:Endochitinase At2g43590-like n=1 Tax=Camelina sativa TaxID=90675 RepID=A0ABM1RQB2_CAMSA|nr:PREDICTED: endochitinase At2g43590-like [Camelina sativa]